MSVTRISDFQIKNNINQNSYLVYVENGKNYKMLVDGLSSYNPPAIIARKTFYEQAVSGLTIVVPEFSDTTIFLNALSSVSTVNISLPVGFDGQSVLIVATNSLPSLSKITCALNYYGGGSTSVDVELGIPHITQYVESQNTWISI